MCSRNAWSRREGRDWPDIYHLTEYTDNVAGKHRAPRPKFAKGLRAGAALPRNASAPAAGGSGLGPGSYRVDRDIVIDAKGECRAPIAGRTSLSSTFPLDARLDRDGMLKGVSTRAGGKQPNPVGPGQYAATDPGSNRRTAAAWSVPAAVESPDALRQRKSLDDARELGPGRYETVPRSAIESASGVLDTASFALPRRLKRCHHQEAFGQIFASMRSRPLRDSGGSMGAAKAALGVGVVDDSARGWVANCRARRPAGGAPAPVAPAAGAAAGGARPTEKDVLVHFSSFGR